MPILKKEVEVSMGEDGLHTEEIFLFFLLFKCINFKALSKKTYTIIKKSLEKFVDEKITIKFPNDLLINGSKVCGILQERITYNRSQYFIVGIGINLIKCPKIQNKQVSFLQKYNNNKINKKDIYKKIKPTLKDYLMKYMYVMGDIETQKQKYVYLITKKLIKKKIFNTININKSNLNQFEIYTFK